MAHYTVGYVDPDPDEGIDGAGYSRDFGDFEDAREHAKVLLHLHPDMLVKIKVELEERVILSTEKDISRLRRRSFSHFFAS